MGRDAVTCGYSTKAGAAGKAKSRATFACLLAMTIVKRRAAGKAKSRATFSFYSRSLYGEAEGCGESEDRKAAFVLLALCVVYLRPFFVLLI